MSIDFTEAMNEVSGLGGYYERVCRAAVVAGAKWCAEHPNRFDLRDIEKAICQAVIATDDGRKVKLEDELTLAQLGAAMFHLRFIRDRGWNEYVAKMSVPLVVYDDEGLINEYVSAE